MGGAKNPYPVKKAATILHDYSDRNPSYRQSCPVLTARNFTVLTPSACELVQIKKDPLIFHIFPWPGPRFSGSDLHGHADDHQRRRAGPRVKRTI